MNLKKVKILIQFLLWKKNHKTITNYPEWNVYKTQMSKIGLNNQIAQGLEKLNLRQVISFVCKESFLLDWNKL